MPVYEYRCAACGEIAERVSSVAEMRADIACARCGGVAHRIISVVAVKRAPSSKLDRLDARYDKMVDRAMQNTAHADPDRLLKRMRPFSET